MKSQYYTREKVEQRASATLRAYQQKTRKPLVLPIDAELVGEIVFGLSWDWDQLDEPPGQRVLAALYVGEARAVLNERYLSLFEDKPGLEQYTRAHEVGHADLHVEPGQLGSGGVSGLILQHRRSQIRELCFRKKFHRKIAVVIASSILYLHLGRLCATQNHLKPKCGGQRWLICRSPVNSQPGLANTLSVDRAAGRYAIPVRSRLNLEIILYRLLRNLVTHGSA